MTSKILIVDDNSAFRDALKHYLKKQFTTSKITEARTGEEGVRIAAAIRPDIVLMDIKLPHMDGIAASGEIKKAVPACIVIVLSLFADDIRKKNAVTAAIDDVIGKDKIEEKLMPLLRKYIDR